MNPNGLDLTFFLPDNNVEGRTVDEQVDWKNGQTERQTDVKMYRQTDRWRDRQMDRQTDRQTDRRENVKTDM